MANEPLYSGPELGRLVPFVSAGPLAALQQILGHSSVVTTQRYSRIADDMILREAERIEARGVAKGVANGLEA